MLGTNKSWPVTEWGLDCLLLLGISNLNLCINITFFIAMHIVMWEREKEARERKWVEAEEEKIVKGSSWLGTSSGPTPMNLTPHDAVRSSPNTLKSSNSSALTTPHSSRFLSSCIFLSFLQSCTCLWLLGWVGILILHCSCYYRHCGCLDMYLPLHFLLVFLSHRWMACFVNLFG